MKGSIKSFVSMLVLASLAVPQKSFAGSDENATRDLPAAHTARHPWYLRIQQAPLIGLAAVSDSGVLDLELMKSVNQNFWIGPTVVVHADKSADTKMRSLNLGVRADFILPAFGNIEEGVYLSAALLLGTYTSQTYTEVTRNDGTSAHSVDEVTCDFKSQGTHRAGAFVIGKQFHMSEDLHLTAGLGVVKSRVMSANQSGFCRDKTVIKSEGRELPWFDLGVGFKL